MIARLARPAGREWRTAPLWGIGLAQEVDGKAAFLHDGRARTLMEAILWHGGEAQGARDSIVALDKAKRDALNRFPQIPIKQNKINSRFRRNA